MTTDKRIRSSRPGRLVDYLAEMFPPWIYVPMTAAHFGAIYLALQALAGAPDLQLPWRGWAGLLTVLLTTLLLRVYDELKDSEVDIRLGRAGDPAYVNRPIVTGRVRVEDLVTLRQLVSVALFAVNLPLGFPWPLVGFLGLFALLWLSSRWFFWPAISQNLLLAFVTHNPLSLAVVGYVVGVYVGDFGASSLGGWTLVLALGCWTPMAAWETSRKIRHAAGETDYQTYSKLLGPKVAPLLPMAFTAISALCLTLVAREAGVSWIYTAAVGLAAAVVEAACLRFLIAPSEASARLRPLTEAFLGVANVGLVAGLWVQHGLVFTVAPS